MEAKMSAKLYWAVGVLGIIVSPLHGQEPKERATFDKAHEDKVTALTFSPDGRLLASASFDNKVKLWDTKTGKLRATLEGHEGRVWEVAFSPNGRMLASTGQDKTIKLWEVITNRLRATLSGHADDVFALAFNPNGTELVSASLDQTIKLWNVAMKEEKATFRGHHSVVHWVTVVSGSKVLAAGVVAETTVTLWEATTGRVLATFKDADRVLSVAFTPDGSLLASGNRQCAVELWDVKADKKKATYKGHNKWVSSMAFSLDGGTLAAGGSNGPIKLWDVKTGVVIATLPGHITTTSAVAFSPDGTILASGSWYGEVKLWDVDGGKNADK
jgi:WD40 repeat protein